MEKNNSNKIEEVVSTAMDNLQKIITANTVVGTAIKTEDGDFLYPVSKICFGVLTGGGEYGKNGIFTKNKTYPFSAGNGSFAYVKPCGFLIKNEKGEYKIIAEQNSLDYIVDKTLDIIDKIKE
ncbi:MAG: spore germination protein GerW family protein [Clostridia bacterium]|nr:spore germination protein GerW family protein [Clostridia bacterium]